MRPALQVYPPLPPWVYARPPATDLPFPLGEPGCRLFAQGRQALYHGVTAIGLRSGDEVLMPAYHHGSEVEALLRAGLRCRVYGGTPALEPDEAELDALRGPATRALHLTHYLGFPQDVARWRRFCDARGLLLIEDVAQAWLAEADGVPLGSHGDLAVFCLYKTFGLPDGAAGLVAQSPPVDYGPRRLGARELARRNLAWLRGRGLASDRRDGTRGPPAPPSRQFELGEPGRPPAAASGMLLRRVLDTFAADRRRAHYALLLDELGERVPPPFDRLPAGAAPFAFPLESHDKPREVARLAERGIEALDFWSAGHPALAGDAFPEVAARRATTIALPVHQELRPADVEAIADAARGGTPPRRGLRLEPLPLDAVSPGEWNALALAAGNVFGTWEWVSAWWRHLGGGAEWMATACRAPDGRLVGILPLCRTSRRRLRALEFLGNGPADRLGPLCAPADRPRVARAFAASLDRRRWPCDLLLGQYLPREEGWTAALGATIQASEPEAALDLAGRDWEAVTGGWSRKVRKGLAYSERRLVQDHGAGFRLLTDRPGLERQLDTLFALHAARWEGERSLFLEQQAFHRDFALAAADAGWARLWLLEADGRPVAAWYSLRFAGAEWLYQSGRDPAWDRRSVGAVLLVHAIREAHRDGVPEFRFLGGDQEYKRRLSNRAGTVDVVARAAGPAGEAALAARAAKHLLKAWTPRRRSPAPASA